MFSKILIANRGEIACRVAATARRMGIRTVAVYSEADAGASHVAACDEAVLIGPAPASDSYLRGDKIIAVALASGAQAIHPGYGFLSENAAFAQACAQAGLVFIGPPVTAIEAMGSKSAAKALMETAGVPLVPGYHGDEQDVALLRQEADRIGYPVLLKASAGGGGKGMRVVEDQSGFDAALASCKREASNSFGNDKVLVERYLTRPRHVEIQIFADHAGTCLYLSERDCSVQRRHQKVLEEAPAPGLSDARRRAMGEAAVAAARAVGYVGAGTVEFIVDCADGAEGAFYFMEMNTRLQVEHPVTEMITGLDLVEWQLRVASGEPVSLRQDQVQLHGHAIEARIYAECPEKGFLPSIGTLHYLDTPPAVQFATGASMHTPAAVRIDAGVREGDAISPFYDPMIAKLIVWGEDRSIALGRMAMALSQVRIVGLACNVGFLQRLVRSQAFVVADLDTGLIQRHHAALFPPLLPPSVMVLALAAAALLSDESAAVRNADDPWEQTNGWRMNGSLLRSLRFTDDTGAHLVEVQYLAISQWRLHIGDAMHTLQLRDRQRDGITIALDGHVITAAVVRDGEAFHVFDDDSHRILTWQDPHARTAHVENDAGRLTAPMPGKIVAILAETGRRVAKGEPLLIMEAMKMEHTIAAPADGVVEVFLYPVGEQVAEGAQLLAFTPA